MWLCKQAPGPTTAPGALEVIQKKKTVINAVADGLLIRGSHIYAADDKLIRGANANVRKPSLSEQEAFILKNIF